MKRPYLSSGNVKVGRIPTWNLPSKLTCPQSTKLCRKYCYAAKAERPYRPQVLPCRNRNLEASKDVEFVATMSELINRRRSSYIRIHESGDFYDQVYLDKWFEIARNCPSKVFMAFTKSWHLDWTRKPDNLVVYWSVWLDTVNVPESGLKAYAGHCGTGREFECGGKCDICLHCFKASGNVHFKVH